MTIAAELLKVAVFYRGTVESPVGSNRQVFGQRFGWDGVAWCDEFVSEVGRQAYGSYDLVGKFAWTVAHAQWFAAKGRFGTEPRPGAVVFFDWSGGKAIAGIDHVGICIRANTLGGCDTVEGNSPVPGQPDGVWLHARSGQFIVGYGYPEYAADAGVPVKAPPAGVLTPMPGPYAKVAAGSRTVALGSAGDDVKVVQRAVGANADGQFGALTKNAVMAYQKARRLGVDGVVGPATWAWVLNGGVGHVTPPHVDTPALPSVMRVGSTGAGVRALQSRLAARGWKITVDGKFGPGTDTVVRAFQKEKGIGVDGVVGGETWQALWRQPIT